MDSQNDARTRIEIYLKEPNPLFAKWIQEWLDEANLKESKSRFNLRDALSSLKKFPLPLATGKDCAILRGFGPVLCQLIDRKLNEYKQTNLDDYNRSINYESDIQKITQNVRKTKQSKLTPSIAAAASATPKKPSLKSKSTNDLKEDDEQVILNSGKFKIIMLVDTQETNGKSKKVLDQTRLYLDASKIEYEVRHLNVGDFTWICRDNNQNELILPYIVERKRMDDFASSIRDGRFHEQKFRLRDCGLDNLIYLIENHGKNLHVGLPMPTLEQAATNTQIHSEFQIKFTDNHKGSIKYLTILTKLLIKNFKDKILISTRKEDLKPCDIHSKILGLMKFQTFQEASVKMKKFTVREIFIKQLLQLRTLSIDKAFAITEVYPTPKLLLLAYKDCNSQDEAEGLLAKIPFGKLNRPIGMTISKILYQFYCEEFEA